jgi:hypothetical protein
VAGLFTSGGAGWLDLIRGVALALGAALVVVFVEGNLRSVSAARLARVYSTGLFPLACLLVGASLVAATQS